MIVPYLDDCFIPWTKSENELKQLHQILNNLHQDIKFTIDYSNKQLPFLDVLVCNTFGKIETDIYYEETDSKQYLLFRSCHPHHTKHTISFIAQIRVIVSDEVKLMQRFNELKKFLLKRKYPEQLIDHGIKRVLEADRKTLRKKVPLKNENFIPYVSTCNPRNTELFLVTKSNLPILYQDNILKDLMKKRQIIKSKRQPPNLKRILTRAKFDNMEQKHTVKKCKHPNCGLCKHLIDAGTFYFLCGKIFKVN